MQNRTVVSFDTSVHNRMMKDGLESEAIFAAIKTGYHARLTGLSIEELLETPDTATRHALMATAGRLLHGECDCIHPHNETLRLLISAHEADLANFCWQDVNVSSREYYMGVSSLELRSDDQLSAETKQHMIDTRKQFDQMWTNLHWKLEEIFQRHKKSRPMTLSEVIPHTLVEGGLFWSIASGLYNYVAKSPASDNTVKHFADVCPPFRCVVYAILMAWYHRSMREWDGGEKFGAGRNDLFMAIILPYCNIFVSDEKKGMQAKCLAEIARLAGVPTKVVSYDDFCAAMLVPTFG